LKEEVGFAVQVHGVDKGEAFYGQVSRGAASLAWRYGLEADNRARWRRL